MYTLKLILRNALRHKLRTTLTALGIVVAIVAFGLLQTIVDAWYAGAAGASATRLVTRNAISLVFPLPLSYQAKIRSVPGVTGVSHANWFGGVYVSEKNFFPQFAVEAESYFRLYPEYRVPQDQFREFLRDRRGAIVGRKTAQTFGFRIGDVVPLKGTIYPGDWQFVVRGIYTGADSRTDESQFFFHWTYLNEYVRERLPRRADTVGVYVVQVASAEDVPRVAEAIDALFRNSLAETRTESEQAFQLSFVSMTEAILILIRVVSFVVIAIILAVMANTMAMTARERASEYATFKALGFRPSFLAGLIFGESLAIAVTAGALGIALTFPVSRRFAQAMGTLFPVFEVSGSTVALQLACACAVGAAAAVLPAWRAARVPVAEGLRNIG
ncbi:ABC transporter permease [Pelomicrobium sp. G1]|uniref:ABC transporter permease n=1 Tax=unclassified Pelomicrobium TaxID=2815318 RepID=UPI003F761D80